MRVRSLVPPVLVTVLVSLAALTAAPAATADTPGCVTRKEWKTAKPTYKLKGIHSRFDTRGSQTRYFAGDADTPEEQTRLYERCSGLAHVAIDYERTDGYWRMTYKWGW